MIQGFRNVNGVGPYVLQDPENGLGASAVGINNSTGNFTIATTTTDPIIGNVLDDSLKISINGYQTLPRQPMFYAYTSSTLSNITGDSPVPVVINFQTAVVNVGGLYDGSSIFTAPITARYYFTSTVVYDGATMAMTSGQLSLSINSLTTIYILDFGFPGNNIDPTGRGSYNGSAFIPLTAGDTVEITLAIDGGAKVVDITGGTASAPLAIFSGMLYG